VALQPPEEGLTQRDLLLTGNQVIENDILCSTYLIEGWLIHLEEEKKNSKIILT